MNLPAPHNAETIGELIEKQISLPSPPAVAVQILKAVQNEKSSLQEIAKIISSDPALTAKMLRVANSGMYTLTNKVSSIERALSILGVNVIKNIALSFVIVKDLSGKDTTNFDYDYFWRRSVTNAVAAKLLAIRLQIDNEDIFVAALLQDIGVLVLFLNKGVEYSQLLEERILTKKNLRTLEIEKYGFDHQQLGSNLLQSWGLPQSIFEPIKYHHGSTETPENYLKSAQILKMAGQLSAIYSESKRAEKVRYIQDELRSLFNLDDMHSRELIDDVATGSLELLETFELDPGSIKPFSQMLQEANEELGRMNLSYEQLVMELKESKEDSENLANELRDAMTRLKELVYRDSLTNLYNHRYFQETLSKEIARGLRHQSSVALLMFDIDSFKKVNDAHGHPVGDQVLLNVARTVMRAVRPNDIVARYGGEEFAVVLPHTNAAGMKVFAERLRRSVEGLITTFKDVEILVTISVGGACWTSDRPKVSKKNLVETADRALYMSKHDGRNRVTILQPNDE